MTLKRLKIKVQFWAGKRLLKRDREPIAVLSSLPSSIY